MKYLISIALLVGVKAHAVTDYNSNGVTTPVKQDTVTPANSRPLPVQYLNLLGVRVNLATEATLQTVNTNILGLDTTIQAIDFATETTLLAISTKLPATLGQKTMTGSFAVVVSSDQSAIPTQAPVNTVGTFSEITNLTTVAQTFTAPANAVGFVIETLSSNSVNVRYKVGTTATTTSGMRLEPGRSEYLPLAANISVIAESGTNQVVTVQWVSK